MHWQADGGAAVLAGVLLTVLAFAPRLGIADRLVAAFVGGAFAAYGLHAAVTLDRVTLPLYAFAVPFITVLWLVGGMREPGSADRDSGRTPVRSAEVLMSPALWAELPPPPISPAIGVPLSVAPQIEGSAMARAQLAPASESLFTPATPALCHYAARHEIPVQVPVPPTKPSGMRLADMRQAVPVMRIQRPAEPEPAPEPAPDPAPEPAGALEPQPEAIAPQPIVRPITPPYRMRNLRGEYEFG